MQFIMYLLIRKRPGATLSEENGCAVTSMVCATWRGSVSKTHFGSGMSSPTKGTYRRMCWSGLRSTRPSILRICCRSSAPLGVKELGYEVLGDQVITTLRQRVQEYFAPARQHPPIPTRIYSQIISVLMRELTEFESVAETLSRPDGGVHK